VKSAVAPALRLVEGGRDRQGPARPEALALARALARRDASAIIAGIFPDSPERT